MNNIRNPLEKFGITGTHQSINISSTETVELALAHGEGKLTDGGAFLAVTSPFTGRSPKDKFLVREPGSQDHVWWGKINQPLSPEKFELLKQDVVAYLDTRELYIRDLFASADPAHRLRIRLISESAWQTLFARQLFIRPTAKELENFEPNFTILHAPEFYPDPERHGTRKPESGPTTAVVLDLASRTIIITGTRYAGEIKKSIFTVLNYLLPMEGVLSMHCSANIGMQGDTALFFGLSGTGKTTLSADPNRRLIGDDEHGWSDKGVFNFEGGCYAKTIHLSPEAEPDIYATLSMFGTVLENVVMDPKTRELDLDSEEITENTRAAYPLHFIRNHEPSGMGPHPKNILFLTADAFGVMPPISRLSPEQTVFHFLSGYTAKLAGTERGVTTPEATFSTCFADPFLVLHPTVYAEMLIKKVREHNVPVWLVNTGWTGGPPGVGHRMDIALTRAMVSAVLSGGLNGVATERDPYFGVDVPVSCPGVPSEVLKPRNTWSDPAAYDAQAKELVKRFSENFQQYIGKVSPEVAKLAE